MKKILALLLAALLCSSLAQARQVNAAQALQKIFADEREAGWRFDPLSATSDGEHRFDREMPDVSPEAQAGWQKTNANLLARLHAVAPAQLDAQGQINYRLFDFILSQRMIAIKNREWRMPMNSDSGFFSELLFLAESAKPSTVQDYENYIARLDQFPRLFDAHIRNMRRGLQDGFSLPQAILGGVANVIVGAQFKAAKDCPLYAPFENFPAQIPPGEVVRLRAAGNKAITENVLPAYAKFQQFFEQQYRPRARRSIAASMLPNGKNYYADAVRYYTNLPDATAEGIHATGLAEVKRIRAEMQAVLASLQFKGDFPAFLAFLRSDRQFYATTPEQLLKEAAYLAKTIDAKLPTYFRTLPRTPYGVRAVPETIAPNYTAGRYNPGPMGAAGEYWVNTYALNTRALYALPALTLHEAVPGHHLQGALARELVDVPAFRRNFYSHSFGEGWALYAEKLGVEMGIYRTPYEHFGRLSYEMWRACRLVVDTGIHAKGWSRQQAVDYLSQNTALSEHEVSTEIDRYISWPGQALAYKIGEMKILELRTRAEKALGPRFDIRDFHDAVIGSGSLTLPMLSVQIQKYIDAHAAQN